MLYSICQEFEGIKQRALKVPEDTLEMTDMIKFIKEAKTARLVKLNEQIKVSLQKETICYILLYIHYSVTMHVVSTYDS